jgi:hypoxanthine phosphoribosyltransferase
VETSEMGETLAIFLGVVAAIGMLITSIFESVGSTRRSRLGIESTKKYTQNPAHYYDPILHLQTEVSRFNPDYIVGINKGGILLAAHIAIALKLDAKNLCRVYANPITGEVRYQAPFQGKVVVIDDICRTGATLTTAIRFLTKSHHSASFQSYVLFSTPNALEALRREFGVEKIYSQVLIEDEDFVMPWADGVKPGSWDDVNTPAREKQVNDLLEATPSTLDRDLHESISKAFRETAMRSNMPRALKAAA